MSTCPHRSQALLRAGLWAAAAGFVLWWTLLPFGQDLSADSLSRAWQDIQWVPFVERGRPPLWSDVLGNVALFLPFGLAGWIFLEGRRHRLALLLGVALALALGIELLQLTLPARRTSATDLVVDCLGAALGAFFGRLWELRGRFSAARWFRALLRGEAPQLWVAAFVLCVVVWSGLPGLFADSGGGGDMWHRTQVLASSFRRFPGWDRWLAETHAEFLFGLCLGALTARSVRGGAGRRAVLAAAATLLAGLGLEGLQILVPTRQPAILHSVAFAAGGLLGAALLGNRCRRLGALLVPGIGAAAGALGLANLRPDTWGVLAVGTVLLWLGAVPSARPLVHGRC